MVVGKWYVQFAAIWHWYLLLCIYMILLLFWPIPSFLCFNLVSIGQLELSIIPAYPSLTCF